MLPLLTISFLGISVFNALGGVTWATAVSLSAFYLGHAAVHVITKVGLAAGIAAGAALAAAVVALRSRERRALRNAAVAGEEPTADEPAA
jgi:membrane protein DedA with SNARE-associated domain